MHPSLPVTGHIAACKLPASGISKKCVSNSMVHIPAMGQCKWHVPPDFADPQHCVPFGPQLVHTFMNNAQVYKFVHHL